MLGGALGADIASLGLAAFSTHRHFDFAMVRLWVQGYRAEASFGGRLQS